MKTRTILMTVFIFGLMVMPLVAAEDATTIDDGLDVAAGVTPDSAFYGLETAMERVSLGLTFNKAKKANKALRYAEERLAEAEAMADKGKDNEAEKAQKGHDRLINVTQGIVDKLEVNGDEESAENTYEDVLDIRSKVEFHKEKVARVHNRILERKADQNMSEEQLAHLREVFGRIQERAGEIESKISQKRENIRSRLKVVSESSEEELDDLEERINERINERAENRIEAGKANAEDESQEDENEESNDKSQEDEGASDIGNKIKG